MAFEREKVLFHQDKTIYFTSESNCTNCSRISPTSLSAFFMFSDFKRILVGKKFGDDEEIKAKLVILRCL